MTQITSQDGKIVFRDGKVGTQQACCCARPCDCRTNPSYQTSAGVVPDACEIDYLAIDIQASFTSCGGKLIQLTVLLNKANNWTQQGTTTDEDGCEFGYLIGFGCIGPGFNVSVYIFVSGVIGIPVNNTCCWRGYICDTPETFVTGLTRNIVVPGLGRNGVCCPGPASGVYDGDVETGFNRCKGALIETDITVVMQ